MGACFKSNGKDAYNVCALVALNFDPEPMLAAAIICTAHPQSIAARPATFSIVLQSVDQLARLIDICWILAKTYKRLSMIGNASILGTKT